MVIYKKQLNLLNKFFCVQKNVKHTQLSSSLEAMDIINYHKLQIISMGSYHVNFTVEHRVCTLAGTRDFRNPINM